MRDNHAVSGESVGFEGKKRNGELFWIIVILGKFMKWDFGAAGSALD